MKVPPAYYARYVLDHLDRSVRMGSRTPKKGKKK